MSGVYKEINGVIRRAEQAFIGVDGKARRVFKGYIGVNERATIFWGKCVLPVPTPARSAIPWRGDAIGPTWNNYDSSLMIIGGTTSATAVGTYTATFTIIDQDHYVFSNGETTVNVTWQIAKTTIGFWGTSVPTAYVGRTSNWDVFVQNSDGANIDPTALSWSVRIADTSKAVVDSYTTYLRYTRTKIRGIASTSGSGSVGITLTVSETCNNYAGSFEGKLSVY